MIGCKRCKTRYKILCKCRPDGGSTTYSSTSTDATDLAVGLVLDSLIDTSTTDYSSTSSSSDWTGGGGDTGGGGASSDW